MAAATDPEILVGKEFSYEDLQHFTDNFSEENSIGRTHFGMLYRGKIPQGWKDQLDEKYVTVKMWENKEYLGNDNWGRVLPQYLLDRVKDEIRFLGLPFLESNKNVAKVLGHCFEDDKLGVVYDLNPFDTLRNLMCDKEKLGWRNRVKVAIGLARVVKFIHNNEPQYLIRNLSAAHVVVDQEFNPVIVDFAMILGGDIGDAETDRVITFGCRDYLDPYIWFTADWKERTDVFTVGIILLELILKQIGIGMHLSYKLLSYYYKNGDFNLFVPKGLRGDPDFDSEDGTELTMIAVSCVEEEPYKRPNMDQVVSKMEKLRILNDQFKDN
ncbi:hypothetical protein ACJIZ3_009208 [Penstemon smallii]|uniref:Protein kinase domain-containing protein n=1 Tax=Penstemon smallii TaxID=265156 RepID=A0ABD3TDT8_9LAMI